MTDGALRRHAVGTLHVCVQDVATLLTCQLMCTNVQQNAAPAVSRESRGELQCVNEQLSESASLKCTSHHHKSTSGAENVTRKVMRMPMKLQCIKMERACTTSDDQG